MPFVDPMPIWPPHIQDIMDVLMNKGGLFGYCCYLNATMMLYSFGVNPHPNFRFTGSATVTGGNVNA